MYSNFICDFKIVSMLSQHFILVSNLDGWMDIQRERQTNEISCIQM